MLGYHYAEAGMEGERPLLTTRALLLDIRARAAPAVLRAVEVEGAYLSSRKARRNLPRPYPPPPRGSFPLARSLSF